MSEELITDPKKGRLMSEEGALEWQDNPRIRNYLLKYQWNFIEYDPKTDIMRVLCGRVECERQFVLPVEELVRRSENQEILCPYCCGDLPVIPWEDLLAEDADFVVTVITWRRDRKTNTVKMNLVDGSEKTYDKVGLQKVLAGMMEQRTTYTHPRYKQLFDIIVGTFQDALKSVSEWEVPKIVNPEKRQLNK